MNALELDIHLQRDSFRAHIAAHASTSISGVFGPSGSGKSTLLHCIAGLLTPHDGYINLNGQPVFDSARGVNVPAHQRRVALVFQDALLFPHCTVLQNLRFGYDRIRPSQRRFEPLAIADALRLTPLLNRRPQQLSGGEQRRAAIARAVLSHPQLLLLDEPLTGLDPPLARQTLRLLAHIHQLTGIPMLVVSHQLSDLMSLGENVLVMDNGRSIGQGNCIDLARHSQCLKAIDLSQPINRIPAVVARHDPGAGQTLLQAPHHAQPLRVPLHDHLAPGAAATILLRPGDIALATQPLQTICVQNQLRARIVRTRVDSTHVLCWIDVGVELLVTLTRQALIDHDLSAGCEVWCLFKSTACTLAACASPPTVEIDRPLASHPAETASRCRIQPAQRDLR